MRKILAALILAALLFGAASVSWGKGKGNPGGATSESVTWESAGSAGVTWE